MYDKQSYTSAISGLKRDAEALVERLENDEKADPGSIEIYGDLSTTCNHLLAIAAYRKARRDAATDPHGPQAKLDQVRAECARLEAANRAIQAEQIALERKMEQAAATETYLRDRLREVGKVSEQYAQSGPTGELNCVKYG